MNLSRSLRRVLLEARRTQCQEGRRNISGPAEEIRIPVPYGHISGKSWGPPSGQPILALHGWLDNAATHDGLAERLPEGYRLVCTTYILY